MSRVLYLYRYLIVFCILAGTDSLQLGGAVHVADT